MSFVRLPRTGRERLLLVLALATVITVFTATVPLLRGWFDLRVYYGTVDTWVHHGGRIYDYRYRAPRTASPTRRSRPSACCRWRCSGCAPRSPPRCS